MSLSPILATAVRQPNIPQASWQRLVHPDDYQRVMEAVEAHLSGVAPVYEAEYRLRHRDGRWIWVVAHGRIYERGPDGTPLRRGDSGSIRDSHKPFRTSMMQKQESPRSHLYDWPDRRVQRGQRETAYRLNKAGGLRGARVHRCLTVTEMRFDRSTSKPPLEAHTGIRRSIHPFQHERARLR